MKRILFQTKESVKDRGDIMQYTTPPKKLLIINILDVMKRYTDSLDIETEIGVGTTITMTVKVN